MENSVLTETYFQTGLYLPNLLNLDMSLVKYNFPTWDNEL